MSGLRWLPITWLCSVAYSRPESLAQKAQATFGNDRFQGAPMLEKSEWAGFSRVLVRLLEHGADRQAAGADSPHGIHSRFEKSPVSGRTLATECPFPLGAAEHRKVKTDQREDCLSPSQRWASSAAPVLAEERREVGAKRRPSRGVPFLLTTFLCGMAKKSSAGALSPALSKTNLRARAHKNIPANPSQRPSPAATSFPASGEGAKTRVFIAAFRLSLTVA